MAPTLKGTTRGETFERDGEIAELADPLQAIAFRKLHVRRDLRLRFAHSAREVALADAELDRNISLLSSR